jgi:RNA polymerase sigma-70 factor (ECF subfamily)
MDLETVVSDLAPHLVRYCTGASGDPAVGEELAQEALTALVSQWRRNGPPQSSRAFVYVVAGRLLRRWRWRRRLLLPLGHLVNGHDPDPDPESVVCRRGELRETLRALRSLPRREAQAMLLVLDGDLDVAAAAGVLGISRSAFKMRVHRARRRLVRHLEDGDGRG